MFYLNACVCWHADFAYSDTRIEMNSVFSCTCVPTRVSSGSWSKVMYMTGAKVTAVAQVVFISDLCCVGHAILSATGPVGNSCNRTLRPLFTNTDISMLRTGTPPQQHRRDSLIYPHHNYVAHSANVLRVQSRLIHSHTHYSLHS